MIKLIMSDLDGTLLKNDSTVSPYTKQTLAKLKAKGIAFGIATGRTLDAVEGLVKEWGIVDYCDAMIGMNGGQVVDYRSKIRENNHPLDGAVIHQVIRDFETMDVHFVMYSNNKVYTDQDNEIARRLMQNNGFEMIVGEFDRLLEQPQAKLLILCDPENMERVEEHFASLHYTSCRGFRSSSNLFEVVDPRISKRFGIERICELRGIALNEVMAFGDNDNDIEMIRDVGYGICMGNGTSKAKFVAKEVIESNEEDGLAKFLNSYFSL